MFSRVPRNPSERFGNFSLPRKQLAEIAALSCCIVDRRSLKNLIGGESGFSIKPTHSMSSGLQPRLHGMGKVLVP